MNQHIERLLNCTHCVKANTRECCVLKDLLNQVSQAQGEVSGDSGLWRLRKKLLVAEVGDPSRGPHCQRKVTVLSDKGKK